MGLCYQLYQDRFYITVKVKSLVTNSLIEVPMLYDTGAQVSTFSRKTLENLELYTLIEQREYEEVNRFISHSGKIGVASGGIYDMYKLHVPSIELIDSKEFNSITLKSDELYFDFHKDGGIKGSDILGLDLIKYFDSKISMNVGKCYLSISEPIDFNRRIINNQRTSKTDNILLSNNEIRALLNDYKEDNQNSNDPNGFNMPSIGF